MNDTKITRCFDDLGRIVIPREIRLKVFGTGCVDGKRMEISYEDDGTITLKPYKEEE
jgi:bifunctional DNA-binding transcriptional regulator/antitoxin component of YhaV-PrlF toxin-antitoxin module